MKNIFIDIDCSKIHNLPGRKYEAKLKSIAKKNNITLTRCRAMALDIYRIRRCQDKIIKLSSKVW